MRTFLASGGLAALLAAAPTAAAAQQAAAGDGLRYEPQSAFDSGVAAGSNGLRQTTTIDIFDEPRVQVSAGSRLVAGPDDRAPTQDTEPQAGEARAARRARSGAASQLQQNEQAADLDEAESSVLAFSGGASSPGGPGGRQPPADGGAELAQQRQPDLEQSPADAPQLRGSRGAAGIRQGAFLVYPELEVGGVYTSNVATTPRDGPDDHGLRLAPRVSVRSDWVRHAFAIDAEGEHVFYADDRDQNTNDLSVLASGRLDIRSATTLEVSAGFDLSQSTSADVEVPDTARGTRNDMTYSVLARLSHLAGRVVGQVTASASWLRFGDVDLAAGGVEDNEDRNYVAPAAGLRLGYQVSGNVQPFVEAIYAPRIHEVGTDRNGLRRDSHGVVLRAGVTFNDGAIWSGEVAARYEFRTYEDTALEDQSIAGVDANVIWQPSALTTVSFSAASGIDESSDISVSGAMTWSGGVQVSHQFTDYFSADAGIAVGYTDYAGVTDELLITTALGVAFAVHRNVDVVGGYEFTTQNPGAGDGYDEHRVSSGLRFRI